MKKIIVSIFLMLFMITGVLAVDYNDGQALVLTWDTENTFQYPTSQINELNNYLTLAGSYLYLLNQTTNLNLSNFTIHGINGINGINGTNGINGINGLNGTNGINGLNGTITNYTNIALTNRSENWDKFGLQMGFNTTIGNTSANYLTITNKEFSNGTFYGGFLNGKVPLLSFYSPDFPANQNVGLINNGLFIIQDINYPMLTFLSKNFTNDGKIGLVMYDTDTESFVLSNAFTGNANLNIKDLNSEKIYTSQNGTSNEWIQAYNWGNHASMGYLTINDLPNVSLTDTNDTLRVNDLYNENLTIWDSIGNNSISHYLNYDEYNNVAIFKNISTNNLVDIKANHITAKNLYLRNQNGNITANYIDTINTISTSNGNSNQWQEAYSWGNHALSHYLTAGNLSNFGDTNDTLKVNGLMNENITIWNNLNNISNYITYDEYNNIVNLINSTTGNKINLRSNDITARNLYLRNQNGNITANYISTINGYNTSSGSNSNQWEQAYSWGNHATMGYLTSYIDTNDTLKVNQLYNNILNLTNIMNSWGGVHNGTNGLNGTNGINGLNGTNGINGLNGTNGINGLNGTNGINGLNGTNGINGLNGTNGINGLNGTNGINGLNGTNGINGLNGTNGINGLNGTSDLTFTNNKPNIMFMNKTNSFGNNILNITYTAQNSPSALIKIMQIGNISVSYNNTHTCFIGKSAFCVIS